MFRFIGILATIITIIGAPLLVYQYWDAINAYLNPQEAPTIFKEKDSAYLALRARDIEASASGWRAAYRRKDKEAARLLTLVGTEMPLDDYCDILDDARPRTEFADWELLEEMTGRALDTAVCPGERSGPPIHPIEHWLDAKSCYPYSRSRGWTDCAPTDEFWNIVRRFRLAGQRSAKWEEHIADSRQLFQDYNIWRARAGVPIEELMMRRCLSGRDREDPDPIDQFFEIETSRRSHASQNATLIDGENYLSCETRLGFEIKRGRHRERTMPNGAKRYEWTNAYCQNYTPDQRRARCESLIEDPLSQVPELEAAAAYFENLASVYDITGNSD